MTTLANLKKKFQANELLYKKYRENQKALRGFQEKFLEKFKKDLFTETMNGKMVLSTTPHQYRNFVNFSTWDNSTPEQFVVPHSKVFNDYLFPEINILSYDDVIELFDMNGELSMLQKNHAEQFAEMFTEDAVFMHTVRLKDGHDDIIDSKLKSVVEQIIIRL